MACSETPVAALQVDDLLLVSCRYGFIEGHVVIPRIHPNSICAANNTGVYILTSNTSQYDTYCFNASGWFRVDVSALGVASGMRAFGSVADSNSVLAEVEGGWFMWLPLT